MKNKRIIISVLVAVLLIGLVGFTYAFFTYSRTGTESNQLQVGKIEFSSTETTINLNNAFPTNRNNLNSSNSGTATITLKGDTTYTKGIEYKVTIEDVNNEINGKKLPISFQVTANNIGTKSTNYYNARGQDANVYKLTEEGEAYNGKYVLVGYIKADDIGINGSINITAFIDKSKMVISDTNSEAESDYIMGREVFTTEEWNSFNSSNPLSFKVKVEAQEGTWVEPEKFLTMKNLNSIQAWKDIRTYITSIEFHKDGVVPTNYVTSFDVTDTTSDSSKGNITLYTVDDGIHPNYGVDVYKAIIVADDTIYAPQNSASLFSSTNFVINFNSNNFKVDNVTNMGAMFQDKSMKNINLTQ